MSIYEEQQLEKWRKIAAIYRKALLDIVETQKNNSRGYVLAKIARDALDLGKR